MLDHFSTTVTTSGRTGTCPGNAAYQIDRGAVFDATHLGVNLGLQSGKLAQEAIARPGMQFDGSDYVNQNELHG